MADISASSMTKQLFGPQHVSKDAQYVL